VFFLLAKICFKSKQKDLEKFAEMIDYYSDNKITIKLTLAGAGKKVEVQKFKWKTNSTWPPIIGSHGFSIAGPYGLWCEIHRRYASAFRWNESDVRIEWTDKAGEQVVATDYRDLYVTFEEMGKSGQLMMRVINKYV